MSRVFSALTQRGNGAAAHFASEALEGLSSTQDAVLFQLLEGLLAALEQSRDLAVRIPSLWLQGSRRLPGSRITTLCIKLLERLQQEGLPDFLDAMEELLTREKASYTTALKLAEMYVKHALHAKLVSGWLGELAPLENADPLERLFNKLERVPQLGAKTMVSFVEAVLFLGSTNPAFELSKQLEELLDKQQAFQLLNNLGELTTQLKASILDTARLYQEQSVLEACTELGGLVVYYERDGVISPNVGLIQQKPRNVADLARSCLPLVQPPV